MFNESVKLKEIKGLNKFQTTKVMDMKFMFAGCSELQILDLSSFDNENAKYMEFMFNKCDKLKEIKGINKFTTNQVTNMKAMFQFCLELVNLDLSKFKTPNVIDISFMFGNCNKLKKIKGLNKFNTINVTDMRNMFVNCSELEYLDLSSFNTTNVTNMRNMFDECIK